MDLELFHSIFSQGISGKDSLDSCSNQNKSAANFVPFQYYATTGEKDEESSQSLSEKTNSTWDQKMDEA